ncbi:MAG: class I SAM-dependent methyltransferase, partial [bacterium]
MEYDAVKDHLDRLMGGSAVLRRLFFAFLNRVFLRSRYLYRELRTLRKANFQPKAILDAGSGFG